jgi:fluoride exporter
LLLGCCGGDTTFSSFSQQTLNLVWDGELTHPGGNITLNITLSVTLCLIALTVGHDVAAARNQMEAP